MEPALAKKGGARLLVNQLEFFLHCTVYLKFSCLGVTPVTNLNIFYFFGPSHLDMVLIFFSKPNVNRDVMWNYPSCELIVKHQAGHAPLFLLRDNATCDNHVVKKFKWE